MEPIGMRGRDGGLSFASRHGWLRASGTSAWIPSYNALRYLRTPRAHTREAGSMWSLRTHITTFVLGLSLAVALPVAAQPDELTEEFGKLSAKERARIAKEEEENAVKDPVFQALMAAGEELFRKGEFEAAMGKYQEARALRPYNVYPKVKVQDLQVLIKQRAEEDKQKAQVVGSSPPPPHPPAAPEESVSPPVIVPAAAAEAPGTVEEPPPPPAVEVAAQPGPIPVRHERPVLTPTEVFKREPVRPVPDTALPLEEGERIYKEGRSIVVETTVVEEGRLVRYRKVSHPWGEEHYFREGNSIPSHAYRSALGK